MWGHMTPPSIPKCLNIHEKRKNGKGPNVCVSCTVRMTLNYSEWIWICHLPCHLSLATEVSNVSDIAYSPQKTDFEGQRLSSVHHHCDLLSNAPEAIFSHASTALIYLNVEWLNLQNWLLNLRVCAWIYVFLWIIVTKEATRWTVFISIGRKELLNLKFKFIRIVYQVP